MSPPSAPSVESSVKRIIHYIKVPYFISLFFIHKTHGKEIPRFDFLVRIANAYYEFENQPKNNYLCNSHCIKTITHKIMHIVTDVTVLNLIYNGNA